MNNKRLIIAILFLTLAGVVALAGFTRVEVWPAAPQIVIYPAGALVLLGLVQLWIFWRRSYRSK